MPGSSSTYCSWGYKSDDGYRYSNGSKNSYGDSFTTKDTVGAGVDFEKQEIFFTKNGRSFGKYQPTKPFCQCTNYGNYQGTFRDDKIKGKLFPVVSKTWNEVRVCANFGKDEQDVKKFRYQQGKGSKAVVRPVGKTTKAQRRTSQDSTQPCHKLK